jgi:hypothetical protein
MLRPKSISSYHGLLPIHSTNSAEEERTVVALLPRIQLRRPFHLMRLKTLPSLNPVHKCPTSMKTASLL